MGAIDLNTPDALTLLADIRQLLKSNAPERLMTAKHVADYLEIGESTFLQEVMTNPLFPKATHVTTGAKGRRWTKKSIDIFIENGGFAKKETKAGRPRKTSQL